MTSNTFALPSSAILTNSSPSTLAETPSIYGRHVRTVVLDKLDARLLLLPQLQVAVDRRRDDKVRIAKTFVFLV